jgi:hypothetical protein
MVILLKRVVGVVCAGILTVEEWRSEGSGGGKPRKKQEDNL